jgi:hypothetical protein
MTASRERPNRFWLHFSDSELARVEALAAAHGLPVGAFVREILARYRSEHEPPGAPLMPALEPEDAAARKAIRPPFFEPPEKIPERATVVLSVVLTDREAALVAAEAEARGLTISDVLRRGVEAKDDTFKGARRNFGERRDRPVSIRLTPTTATQIRREAKETNRTVGDVVLERFAAWTR